MSLLNKYLKYVAHKLEIYWHAFNNKKKKNTEVKNKCQKKFLKPASDFKKQIKLQRALTKNKRK